jgi:hypothetical protein
LCGNTIELRTITSGGTDTPLPEKQKLKKCKSIISCYRLDKYSKAQYPGL